MADNVEISPEQFDLMEAAIQPAIDQLLATGNYVPTLYLHDGDQMTFFTLAVQDQEALRGMSQTLIKQRLPGAVAYALLFDSAIETDEGTLDALIIETGDTDNAHEFARVYYRARQTSAPKVSLLGPAPNLLQ